MTQHQRIEALELRLFTCRAWGRQGPTETMWRLGSHALCAGYGRLQQHAHDFLRALAAARPHLWPIQDELRHRYMRLLEYATLYVSCWLDTTCDPYGAPPFVIDPAVADVVATIRTSLASFYAPDFTEEEIDREWPHFPPCPYCGGADAVDHFPCADEDEPSEAST